MKVIEEQVNRGRFLSAMNLEDVVLADGVLPNQPSLDDRAALVQGILQGMLESGRWQKAVYLVHNPGPVKALFDGNWEGFNDAVIAVAKEQKPDAEIKSEFVQFLVDNNQAGVVCRLIDEIPYSKDNLNNLFNGVYGSVDEAVRSRLRGSIGVRAQEVGDFAAAHHCFKENRDTASIDALYRQILEDPVKNIDLLLKIAGKDKARLTEIVKGVLKLDEEELQEVKIDYTAIEEALYRLVKKHELELDTKEKIQLIDLASNMISSWRDGNAGDKNLAFLWAKKHYQSNPTEAYQIFIAQDYKGDEVMAAVRVAFSKEYMEGRPHCSIRYPNVSMFKEEHLRAVYSEQDAWTRVKIARHLGDKEALLGLSREYYEQQNFTDAYNLWVSGGGSFDDPFAEDLRQGVIQAEEKKGYFSEHLFDKNDLPGKTWLFNKLFSDRKFSAALDIAARLEDEEKLQRVREKMVESDPEWAIGIFRRQFSSDKDMRDRKGFDMCVTALSEKYSLPKEAVVQYVEAGKK